MISGLVFVCGGCGLNLQAITEGRSEFVAQLEEASRAVGKRIVGLYNEDMDAMAVLPDEDGVTCPRCKHRNLFRKPEGHELN